MKKKLFFKLAYVFIFIFIYFQVIYTLNTKNDEHETIVSTLKEKHEDEIEKLLASSTSKLHEIKNKMNNDSQM